MTNIVATSIVPGMPGKLKERIKQTKPFDSLEVEAYLNVVLLSHELQAAVARHLREAGLSLPQYNVLRILRGAGPEGLNCSEVGKRMVHRVPDVTRLLDRLEAQGCIKRERDAGDRRVVRVAIARAGLQALAPLDKPLAAIHKRQLGHMGPAKLERLIALVEEARSAL